MTDEQKQQAREIVRKIAARNEVSVADIMSASRKAPIVAARQMAMYRLRANLGLSYPAIGKFFNRDHSTVMHACQKVKEEIQRRYLLKSKEDQDEE